MGKTPLLWYTDQEIAKLDNPTLGATFELNDHRGVIVGIAQVTTSGLFGMPTLYTTYRRAIQYIPSQRFTTAYILVEPKTEQDIPHIKARVAALGYLGLTKEEFIARISNYYKYQTGVGTNILIMTITSFLVGLSICRPDILYLCPGEPPQIRRLESHRRQKLRARLHDSLSSLLHRLHRLRPGRRPLFPAD